MVAAIRLITVERGYDPRDFTLIAFGGAGPLHAVDIARELEMPDVIVPAYPGVTSALGLLFVDPLDDFSWAFVRRQDELDVQEVASIYDEIGDRVLSSLELQGVERDQLALERSLDLRYVGQLHSITVPLEDVTEDGFARAVELFHAEHAQHYRYSHPEQLVETSTLRVTARGARARPTSTRSATPPARAQRPETSRQVHFPDTGLGRRAGPRPGGARARRRASSGRASSRASTPPSSCRPASRPASTPPATSSSQSRASRGPDDACMTTRSIPITFEVLRNAFMGIVDEMGLMLEKVAHSLVVSEGRDFSTAICDADGRLIAEGKEDLPAHVGTLPHTVKAVIEWIGKDRLHEGDIIIMNDAFLGGTHCQDVRTIMPVYRHGSLVAFTQNSAHWSDLGGPVPGTFHPEAVESYGEALYIPPIHLVREGELDDEVLRFILRNTRVPDLNQGDCFAQIAACRTGETRLQSLIDRHGDERHQPRRCPSCAATRRRCCARSSRKIPDGTYSFEDAIDFDPMGDRVTPGPDRARPHDRGRPCALRPLAQRPRRPAVRSTRRAPWPSRRSWSRRRRSSPTSRPARGCSTRSTSSTRRGWSPTRASPRRSAARSRPPTRSSAPACSARTCRCAPSARWRAGGNMTNMVVGGHDPRAGIERDFVMYLWKEGGYGARPGKKDNHSAISLYASGTRNEPVEVQERVYPILTHRYEFIPDSAGAGLHRGGIGVTRDFELTHGDATLSVLGSRAVEPVWGYDGGQAALGSGLIHGDEELGVMRSGVTARRDTLIRFWEGGGGGWGDPRTRPAEWVREDVIDGYVTIAAAREHYGVEIREVDADAALFEIDEEETARLRASS